MGENRQNSLTDTPLYRFTAGLSRWFAVSALWLVCSLPIVTLGAATKAALAAFRPSEEGGTAGTFFRAFRSGFAQITGVWLLTLAAAALLGLDVWFYRRLSGRSGTVLTGVVLLLGIFLVNYFRFVCFCAFGETAGLRQLLCDAGVHMLCCLPAAGMFTAMDLAVFVTLVNIPQLLVSVLILPGLLADIHSRLLRGFLRRTAADS